MGSPKKNLLTLSISRVTGFRFFSGWECAVYCRLLQFTDPHTRGNNPSLHKYLYNKYTHPEVKRQRKNEREKERALYSLLLTSSHEGVIPVTVSYLMFFVVVFFTCFLIFDGNVSRRDENRRDTPNSTGMLNMKLSLIKIISVNIWKTVQCTVYVAFDKRNMICV